MFKFLITDFYKKKILKFIFKKPLYYSFILTLFLIPSLYFIQKLSINSDFKYLLPQNKPSVTAMNILKTRRKESTQLLSILIDSPDKNETVKVIETLIPPLKKIDKSLVKTVNYTVDDAKAFYKDNKYLYLDLQDIKTIHKRLDAKIRHEKLKSNPLFFDLEDNNVEFDISDIEEKYDQQGTKSTQYKPEQFYKGYFFSKQQDYAIIVLQPAASINSISKKELLIDNVEKIINSTIPIEQRTNFTINLSGSVFETVYEYKTLIKDMLSTLALCLSLVFLIILIYFFSIKAVLLLVIPLIYSIFLLLGFAYFYFDFLNSITVFLLSIIIGNGVNTGILLMSAYHSFSKPYMSKYKAFSKAVNKTVFSTFFSALTTAMAFLCLYFSQINSLKQFGIIGSIGIILAWLCTFLILPIFVFHTSIHPSQGKLRLWLINQGQALAYNFTLFIKKFHRGLAIAVTLFILFTIKHIANFIPNSLEYDFSKLRNKQSNPIFGKANNIFKEVNPSVVLFKQNNIGFCDKILKLNQNETSLLDRCESIYSYIPENQSNKFKELNKIKFLLNDKSLGFLNKKEKSNVKKIKENLTHLQIVTPQKLPNLVSNKFKENESTYNTIAYLYPKRSKLANNSKNLVLYTQNIQQQVSEIGEAIVAGQSFILADLIDAIKNDAPKTTLVSLLVIMIIIVIFLKKQHVFYMMISIIFSFLIMLFTQAVFDIKFNFINFVALPISFGIGIDYAINFFYQLSKRESDLANVIRTTGSAIVVCSMTTIVSYLSLINANSQALASFGKLALIGELSSLFVVLIVLPSYYFTVSRKNKN